jgi:hypothetical protein
MTRVIGTAGSSYNSHRGRFCVCGIFDSRGFVHEVRREIFSRQTYDINEEYECIIGSFSNGFVPTASIYD